LEGLKRGGGHNFLGKDIIEVGGEGFRGIIRKDIEGTDKKGEE
jgi:hypothetical protein